MGNPGSWIKTAISKPSVLLSGGQCFSAHPTLTCKNTDNAEHMERTWLTFTKHPHVSVYNVDTHQHNLAYLQKAH